MNYKNYLTIVKNMYYSNLAMMYGNCQAHLVTTEHFFPVLRDTEVDHVKVVTDYTFHIQGEGRGK